jgi:hypothetical protein
MHFLEFTKWFEKEETSETGFSDFGWVSITELEAYDPDNKLLDNYIVMKEFTNPLGSIYQFLIKKSCLEQMKSTTPVTERTEHQE